MTIVADCVGLFFWRRNENEILFGNFTKRFETMVGVELLEGYKRAVCDTLVQYFLVKFHGAHLPEFFISGQ